MSVSDGPAVVWRKSSACLPSDCVEVASLAGHILVRDSADVAGGNLLVFSADRWSVFARRMREAVPGGKCDLLLKSACLCRSQASRSIRGTTYAA